ncbi:MAG: LysM peptidoglycan-binding domain-containing protein [Nitrospirota bacterium]
MKKRLLLTALFFAVFLVLTPAFAQEEQAADGQAAVGGTYTIKKGDTLWDISKRRLSDPFAWPRIWKDNPFIHDPDLIFPGQVIKLPPGVTIAPRAQTEEAPPAGAVTEGEKPFVEKGNLRPTLPPVSEGHIITIPHPEERQPVANALAILSAGFLEENHAETRPIEGSPAPRDLYGMMDEVYVKADGVQPGDRFIIGRYAGEIKNPETEQLLGTLVTVTGILDIEGPRDGFMVGSISKAFEDVKSTDLLFPYQDPLVVYEPVPPNPKAEGLSGYVAAVKGDRKDSGETDILYIDKGALDGVLPGDSFVVTRSGGVVEKGDGLLKKKETVLPEVEVGRIQVISVRGNTSAAKIVRSDEPLQVGFRVNYSR